MKKNRMMRLASLLLVLVLMTSSVVGGTFAKYTSEATASDNARVAKWSFTVGGQDIAASKPIVFDLFKTINDTAGATENDVAKTEKIIAPGTEGYFEIVLQNTSEVTAKYAIDYDVTNTIGAHIQFSVDGGATWTDNLVDVVASDDTTLAIGSAAKTIKVEWKWAFENTSDATYDSTDTQLGVKAAAGTPDTLSVTAKITATQVD